VVPQHAPGGNVPRPAGYALPVRPDMRLCPLPLAGHRPADCNQIVGEINSHYGAHRLILGLLFTPPPPCESQEPGPPWIPPGQLSVPGPVPLSEQHVRAGCPLLGHGKKRSWTSGGQQSLPATGHVRGSQHSHLVLRGVQCGKSSLSSVKIQKRAYQKLFTFNLVSLPYKKLSHLITSYKG